MNFNVNFEYLLLKIELELLFQIVSGSVNLYVNINKLVRVVRFVFK